MRLLLLLYPWLELLSLIQLGVETSVLFVMLWVIGMFLMGTPCCAVGWQSGTAAGSSTQRIAADVPG